jgi:hypothetical protein
MLQRSRYTVPFLAPPPPVGLAPLYLEPRQGRRRPVEFRAHRCKVDRAATPKLAVSSSEVAQYTGRCVDAVVAFTVKRQDTS